MRIRFLGRRRREKEKPIEFFAWWPKRLPNNTIVWLERVRRISHYQYTGHKR